MGEMQRRFEQLLDSIGDVRHKEVPFPRLEDVKRAKCGDIVNDVYKKLGGVLPSVEINLRPWDLEFNGIAVELDEYLHFNRYRAITLEAHVYTKLPRFPLAAYRRFCSEFECHCLSAGGYGGKWSNTSCERQFGLGSPPKVLEGNGAPRWKQRAFYDFVKDISPYLLGVRLARVAIWDRIDIGGTTCSVCDVLVHPTKRSAEAVVKLIAERTE